MRIVSILEEVFSVHTSKAFWLAPPLDAGTLIALQRESRG